MHRRGGSRSCVRIGVLVAVATTVSPAAPAGATAPRPPGHTAEAEPEIVATELEPLDGSPMALPFDINDEGVVVGTSGDRWGSHLVDGRATVWQGSTARELPRPLPVGPADTRDTAVNSAGAVTGAAPDVGGLVWHGGWPILLGADLWPVDMNERGQIAAETGWWASDPLGKDPAYLWDAGRPVKLVDDGVVTDINERGQVVGLQDHDGDLDTPPLVMLWELSPA